MRCVIAPPVAPQIYRDRTKARVGECDELVAPGPPVGRESVEEKNERAGADLGYVEAGTVGVHIPMGPGARQAYDFRGIGKVHGRSTRR